MRKLFSFMLHVLEKQSVYSLWGIILFTILVVGSLDYLTGVEYSLSLFYIIPVSITAWTLGKNERNFICFLCGVVWMVADLKAGHLYSNLVIPYWNALIRIGYFVIIASLLAELHQTLKYERNLAHTDALTGLVNNRAFYPILSRELERFRRHRRPLTLVYLDLDNFKSINDTLGHQAGDKLLETVARTMNQTVRKVDTVARLGGDEFVILLPETDDSAVKILLTRLQWHLLAEMTRQDWLITFSIGVLTCRKHTPKVDELIQLADQVMYEVKHSGKDGIAYAVI